VGPGLAWLLAALLAVAPSIARADDLADVFRRGNEAYSRGDFAGATSEHERLLELGVRDADVFYNLGTAYARAGRQGRAIAAFERSLRLRPGDAEAIASLERSRAILASRRAEREGEAEVESGRPVGEAVFGGVSVDSLAVLLLVLVTALFALLAAFPFVRREDVRLAIGIATPLLGIAAAVAGLGLAIRSGALDEGTPAIVVRERAPLREGPHDDAQERARGHEGERVWIVARDGEWVRVTAGARTGWLPSADVVALVD
jgi:tetratricopeptide (TPR) repeat protein